MLQKCKIDCHVFLQIDSLHSSHPISVPVGHPDAINEIFDSISYGKGASVIRMMANFLGLEAFNTGITDYLNMHKFGNAKQVNIKNSVELDLLRNAYLSSKAVMFVSCQTSKSITWFMCAVIGSDM